MQSRYLLRDGIAYEPQRIDRFPNSPLACHCINALTHNWTGTIRVLASIEIIPGDNDWFEVVREDLVSNGNTRNLMWTVTGCLIWMKVELLNDAGLGRIDRITAI